MSRQHIYSGIIALGVLSAGFVVYQLFLLQDAPPAQTRTAVPAPNANADQDGSPIVKSPALVVGPSAASLVDQYPQAAGSDERGTLLIKLARTGDPVAVPVLIGALEDSDGEVRLRAYAGLQYLLHTTFEFHPLQASPEECKQFAQMLRKYWDGFEKAMPAAVEAYELRKREGKK